MACVPRVDGVGLDEARHCRLLQGPKGVADRRNIRTLRAAPEESSTV